MSSALVSKRKEKPVKVKELSVKTLQSLLSNAPKKKIAYIKKELALRGVKA